MNKRDYDSTIARIAGNLLSGHPYAMSSDDDHDRQLAAKAVFLARCIVAETRRVENQPANEYSICRKCGVVEPCTIHSSILLPAPPPETEA